MPSIGSTTSTVSASPAPASHQSPVLRVEGDVRGPLGQEPLQERLRLLVDRERHVAAGAGLHVRAAGVGAEKRQHVLAQPERQLDDQLLAAV